jgi:hypothetical protein
MKRIIITAALALGATTANARSTKRRYVLAFFQKLAPCLVGIEAALQGQNGGGHGSHGPLEFVVFNASGITISDS